MKKYISFILLIPMYVTANQDCSNFNYDQIIDQVKQKNQTKRFQESEKCLKNSLNNQKYKNNPELQEMLIRSLLWQKKYIQAKNHIISSSIKDLPKNQLLSDLYWYQEDFKGLYDTLRTLVNKFKLRDEELVKRLIVSKYYLFGKDAAKKQYEQGLILFPNSMDIKELNSLWQNRKKAFINTEHRHYDLSQGEIIRETDFNVSYSDNNYSLGLSFSNVLRQSDVVSLHDQIYTIQTGFNQKQHYLNFDIGLVSSPEFSYNRRFRIQYLYEYKKFFAGIEMDRREYASENLNLYNFIAEYYYKKYYFQVKAIDMFKVFLLKASTSIKKLTGDIWLSFGKSESSRPYLISSNESSFNVYGAKLKYILPKGFEVYIANEYRNENSFDYNMLSGGMSWSMQW